MAALSASQQVTERSALGAAFQVENAETTYAGGAVALNAGYLRAFQGAAGDQPVGRAIAQGSTLGDTSATPVPEQSVNVEPHVIQGVPVAGASTIAHVGRLVYLNDTDNPVADLTLTRPTRAIPYGRIVRFRSATSFDVRVYGMGEIDGIQGVGQRETIHIGNFNHAELVTGNIRTGYVAPFHGRILTVYAFVNEAFTGAAGTAALNLEIATVDVTGGVVTVSTAAGGTVGTRLAGTAVTAANEFHEGEAIDLEAVGSGTQTEGNCDVYMDVERLPGV